MTTTVLHGDALSSLRKIPDNSIDAVITDPPYGLSNTDPKHVAETIVKWASGDREYIPTGKGFMGEAWDAFVPPPAVWDECLRVLKPGGHLLSFAGSRTFDLMTLSIRLSGFDIRDSIAWLYGSGFPKGGNKIEVKGQAGWGVGLKPAFEPIVVARKPFPGTVAANVLAHGTGALNIDATRIELAANEDVEKLNSRSGGQRGFANAYVGGDGATMPLPPGADLSKGRWPANVMLDESQAETFDESRFFYVAKASKKERPTADGVSHPTVKPLTLMRQFVKLVTPPGGLVLDPFAGSGTTSEAAILEGFDSISVEMSSVYLPLIEERISRAEKEVEAENDY